MMRAGADTMAQLDVHDRGQQENPMSGCQCTVCIACLLTGKEQLGWPRLITAFLINVRSYYQILSCYMMT